MGKLSSYKTKVATSCLEKKLSISLHDGSERTGYYILEGVKALRVTIPKEHGGHGDGCLSKFVAKQLISSLRLSKEEFNDLYRCPMSGTDYMQKMLDMRKSGLL